VKLGDYSRSECDNTIKQVVKIKNTVVYTKEYVDDNRTQ
jgi:hypothetical protein